MLPKMLDAASTMQEFTARTLADKIGTDLKKVADLLGLHNRRGSGYFRRLRRDGCLWVYTKPELSGILH
ncbi:hypothetical protein FXV91_18125 [Methanosarcina sp. DH2]|uniref:hypothetical protein n=1 Tax=Methanosarcina sp. DH2 TaxID=2605639 RepID=UPI001E4C812B|nr:hypothetical protein [Methanosarcina sp. DH2]MCC4772009.1 hypothetical protein [Methanosarcina sp. DH2]